MEVMFGEMKGKTTRKRQRNEWLEDRL